MAPFIAFVLSSVPQIELWSINAIQAVPAPSPLDLLGRTLRRRCRPSCPVQFVLKTDFVHNIFFAFPILFRPIIDLQNPVIL